MDSFATFILAVPLVVWIGQKNWASCNISIQELNGHFFVLQLADIVYFLLSVCSIAVESVHSCSTLVRETHNTQNLDSTPFCPQATELDHQLRPSGHLFSYNQKMTTRENQVTSEPSPLLKEKLVKHSKAEQLHQIIKWSESEVGPASK